MIDMDILGGMLVITGICGYVMVSLLCIFTFIDYIRDRRNRKGDLKNGNKQNET